MKLAIVSPRESELARKLGAFNLPVFWVSFATVTVLADRTDQVAMERPVEDRVAGERGPQAAWRRQEDRDRQVGL